MNIRKILAWGVHFYTALGLVAAAGIAVLIVRGDANSFRWAFVLMGVATLIDATDGLLARKVNVKEVTPGFDGRRLDDLIDFHTYTTLPLLLVWRAELLPVGQEWALLLPLLASAYGFCQVNAKTDDHFFIGFPSYWNIVAFYLFALNPPAWLTLVTLVTLALLTFVPSRYLYTSHRGQFSLLMNLTGTVWAVMSLVILFLMPDAPRWLVLASLFYPLLYMGLSWLITIRHWQRSRQDSSASIQAAQELEEVFD